jgi:hypothetical protein
MAKNTKYRYLKEGEKLKRSDTAKHKCDCLWYENFGIKNCHIVEKECADMKCYKRNINRKGE